MLPFLRRKPRILLLDDDPSMQRLVITLLRREGLRVDAVGTGKDAIAAIDKRKYDALLLDLMMPHEGGITVIAHLRTSNPSLLQRVIILTGTSGGVLKKIEHEIFGVVRKPFAHAALVDTVRRLLGRKA